MLAGFVEVAEEEKPAVMHEGDAVEQEGLMQAVRGADDRLPREAEVLQGGDDAFLVFGVEA